MEFNSADISAFSEPDLLGGTVRLSIPAVRITGTYGLYSAHRPEETPCTAYAVPYYTWGNRGENQMRVWLPI